jgi:DNA-binding NtrC family response regulator
MAATQKDLRREMNENKFRADLYYRLAVLRMRIPAVKERPEDIPLLVKRLLDELGTSHETNAELYTPEFLAGLQHAAWPGNIRELRNHLERCIILEHPQPLDGSSAPTTNFIVDATRPHKDEMKRVYDTFEREYLEKLMGLHGDNVTKAAAAANVTRMYLHRLIRKHGIRHE